MDYLRQGIHLRGYAQKDPKQEYKREAFTMFNDMLARFKHEVTSILARVQIQSEAEVQEVEEQRRAVLEAQEASMQTLHQDAPDMLRNEASAAVPLQQMGAAEKPETFVRDLPKVGRNDPCPCGSGKKYKQCHGQLA